MLATKAANSNPRIFSIDNKSIITNLIALLCAGGRELPVVHDYSNFCRSGPWHVEGCEPTELVRLPAV